MDAGDHGVGVCRRTAREKGISPGIIQTKKTKEKNTGAQEERTEMSQVPSLQRWYDAYKVHVSYSCGQHPRAGSGCHHAGHGTAAGASHSGGKGKMRNSMSVPASMA